MAIDTKITAFAVSQFGDQAEEVVRGVVEALGETQALARGTQRASGMSTRHPHGSTWPLKYAKLVEHLSKLPGAEVVPVPGTEYQLVRVNGRLLVPFVLAQSLTEIPARPRIRSAKIRDVATKGVPAPAPQPDLFTDFDELLAEGNDTAITLPTPRPSVETRTETDQPEIVVETDTNTDDCPAVIIGVVGNADSDVLLALRWGTAITIDEKGYVEWSPEPLPVQVAPPPSESPRPVPDPETIRPANAFNRGIVPPVSLEVRSTPLDPEYWDATNAPGGGLSETGTGHDPTSSGDGHGVASDDTDV